MPTTRTPRFVVFRSRSRSLFHKRPSYRFRLVSSNGEKMLQSEPYPTQAHAVRGARAVARIAGSAVVVDKHGRPL